MEILPNRTSMYEKSLNRANRLQNFLRSLAVTLFLFKMIPGVDAQELQKWFANQAVLQCGSHEIATVTSCVEREKDLPYCFNQTIVFIQSNGDVGKSLTFSYSFNDGNQNFIESASCVAISNKNYVAIQSTNFGNCKYCEWADIFSEAGNYVGSSDTKNHDKEFSRKKLSPNFEKAVLLELTKKKPNSTVFFYRTR